MRVEIDLFSGRPNPAWTLDGGEAHGLRAILADLSQTSRRPPEPPGLGYRGFQVTDGAHTYRVYREWVQADSQTLADPDRTAERWLVDHVPGRLAALVSAVI